MKRLLKSAVGLALSGLLLLTLAGCGGSTEPAPVAGAQTQTVQAGCGSCIYSMAGVEGCQLAVKIDGTPYLVTGASVDAHSLGLCEAEKTAVVVGQVENGKFVAQSFELKP